jgi:hypothetical protein
MQDANVGSNPGGRERVVDRHGECADAAERVLDRVPHRTALLLPDGGVCRVIVSAFTSVPDGHGAEEQRGRFG